MKAEDMKNGMDVWTIRATNLRVPRAIFVVGGTLRHVKDKWHDYWVLDPHNYSFKPSELFSTMDEAEDALIRMLDRTKKAVLKQRRIRRKMNEEQKTTDCEAVNQ